jgi:plastocyanin
MRRTLPLVAVSLLLAALDARAQSTCVTPNCVFGGSPPSCINTAAARTPLVLMTTSGINFVFTPSEPRIEPGDCVQWRSSGATHSGTAAPCTDDSICGSVAPPACTFDTGNVASAASTTCQYTEAQFPASSANNFYCRIHASPTTGTMRGVLRVTTPIVLTVAKNVANGSIDLSWTGGGVTGDASYKVAKQTVGDPKFPLATTTTVNPDAGVLGTAFTDAGELSNPATRYYLVRNKQTNE